MPKPTPEGIETRAFFIRRPEVRAEGEKRTIAGYAAVFNAPTVIGSSFREVIAPGAFAATLNDDVRALFDHDAGRVLGRTRAGTLRLKEDDKGLYAEIDLPDTSDGRDVAMLIERGDLDGMSFGFVTERQEWDETTEPPTRTIRQVKLFEVSVVAFPQYADTSVAMRCFDAERQRAEVEAEAVRRRAANARARELELSRPRGA